MCSDSLIYFGKEILPYLIGWTMGGLIFNIIIYFKITGRDGFYERNLMSLFMHFSALITFIVISAAFVIILNNLCQMG